MRATFRLGAIALCGLALLAVSPREVAADTYGKTTAGATLSNGSANYTVNLSAVGGSSTQTMAVFTTVLSTGNPQTSSNTFATLQTYCVDLNGVANNLVKQAQVSTQSGSVTGGGLPSPRNLGAAGWVLANYQNTSSSSWASILTGNALSGTAAEILTQQQAIIQAAVWQVTFKSSANALNITSIGNASTNMNTVLGKLLASATDSSGAYRQFEVGFVDYSTFVGGTGEQTSQDQAFAVPEPGTYGMAISAVGMLFGARFLRRRRLMTA